MQPLHSALKRRLLAQHAHIGEAAPQRRLTAEVLRRYESLVQMHCELCRVAQSAPDSFRWPYLAKAERGAKALGAEAQSTTTTPFQKLAEQKPATAQEALRVVEDTMSEVLDYYLPYFYSVHAQWARGQQREARRVAKRAYGW
jgi:hypothetical protein